MNSVIVTFRTVFHVAQTLASPCPLTWPCVLLSLCFFLSSLCSAVFFSYMLDILVTTKIGHEKCNSDWLKHMPLVRDSKLYLARPRSESESAHQRKASRNPNPTAFFNSGKVEPDSVFRFASSVLCDFDMCLVLRLMTWCFRHFFKLQPSLYNAVPTLSKTAVDVASQGKQKVGFAKHDKLLLSTFLFQTEATLRQECPFLSLLNLLVHHSPHFVRSFQLCLNLCLLLSFPRFSSLSALACYMELHLQNFIQVSTYVRIYTCIYAMIYMLVYKYVHIYDFLSEFVKQTCVWTCIHVYIQICIYRQICTSGNICRYHWFDLCLCTLRNNSLLIYTTLLFFDFFQLNTAQHDKR